MKYVYVMFAAFFTLSSNLYADSNGNFVAACAFDKTKDCTLVRDILVDRASGSQKYYYTTARSRGNAIFVDCQVNTYSDAVNAPGQIAFAAFPARPGSSWYSGEIYTKAKTTSPTSAVWISKEVKKGYLEVIVKMPKCEMSDDGLCQSTDPSKYPTSYNYGSWPALLLTVADSTYANGEISIAEGYKTGSNFVNTQTILRFKGTDSRCQNGNCATGGFLAGTETATAPLYSAFHVWGFTWEPDTASTVGGQILTGYFDGVRAWGPLKTDSLPAEGKAAFGRGFAAGYYFDVNLAIGGYAGAAPNAHVQMSRMYLQSAKVYSFGGTTPPPPNTCKAPVNVISMNSPDKKQVTLSWQEPTGSSPIQRYRIANAAGNVIWTGMSKSDRCFTDQSLPGTGGTVTYNLTTVCDSGTSPVLKYDVVLK